MALNSLPLFVRLAGRPVMLLGEGDAADAKRRLLERAGGAIVGEEGEAQLAIVALDDPEPAVSRLKARGILVNAVDRPDLCDFTLPAIVDRDPVLIAVGTGGASAGLAAALRQRLEALIPASLGELARALAMHKGAMRNRWPGAGDRRMAIGHALAPGATLDPLREHQPEAVILWLAAADQAAPAELLHFVLDSPDPDDLTLRQARALALAERVHHRRDVPAAILARARADAIRIACDGPPANPGPGLSVYLEYS